MSLYVKLSGNYEKLNALLKDELLTNEERDMILIFAACRGKKDIVLLLLNNGANVNAKLAGYEEWGWMISNTALMLAALNFHHEIVRMLLKRGADVNARNNKGDTALMMIACCQNNDSIKIAVTLFEYSADVNIKNNTGDTALMIFCNIRFFRF